ncbi:hypothetical protein ZIOFF_053448 [Zingiber officinale]|uniref:cyclin-dependent kinase n=1 Tax=Zingiber officinale TaxID=94328 RepID=A0A8J5KII6_ZINOF|nr:hypothetical protein ZIOFF_053448 [Zingiber officinale]
MDRYKLIKEVGDGTFGTVWRAINKQSGEVVAIKKLKRKYYSWEECLNLREVKSLRRLNHPNIVKLKEVIRDSDMLHLVFEYMDCNLYQLMKERGKPFSDVEIRNWCFQIFRALAYMHHHGYFHRDLKPENLLVIKNLVKIADFGLAREVHSKPPFTEYVSTRWYRAPEVLLQSSIYSSAVDMWAMGAIMAELFTLRPLFPGLSEADELFKICNVIGSPNSYSWSEGLQLAEAMKYQFPQFAGIPLSVLIPTASKDAVDLISSLCSWDSTKRPSALEVLHHSFFQSCFHIPPSPQLKPEGVYKTPSSGVQRKLEMNHQDRRKDRRIENDVKPYNHQIAPRNIKDGSLVRDVHRTSTVIEKLANLKLNSNRGMEEDGKLLYLKSHPHRQPPKNGVWRAHAYNLGRPREVPAAGSYYTRKVVG